MRNRIAQAGTALALAMPHPLVLRAPRTKENEAAEPRYGAGSRQCRNASLPSSPGAALEPTRCAGESGRRADIGPSTLQSPALPVSSSRCTVKGCVFPAGEDNQGRCFYHELQRLQPRFFASFQPTILVLEQAKFILPEGEPDDSRIKDRHRSAIERQAFLLEDAA